MKDYIGVLLPLCRNARTRFPCRSSSTTWHVVVPAKNETSIFASGNFYLSGRFLLNRLFIGTMIRPPGKFPQKPERTDRRFVNGLDYKNADNQYDNGY